MGDPIIVKHNQDAIIKVYPQNAANQPANFDLATLKAPSTNPLAFADAILDPSVQAPGKAFYTMRAAQLSTAPPGAIATFTPTAMAGTVKVTGPAIVLQTEGTPTPPITNPATHLDTFAYPIDKA